MAQAFGHASPHDRDTLILIGKRVKESFDAAILIRHAIALLSELGRPNRLLFDGLRVEGEASGILELVSENTKVACIAVTTGAEDSDSDLRLRYRRSLKRGSDKDPQEDTESAFEKFKLQDEREAPGINEAIKYATHTVVNRDGNENETLSQVDAIMNELGIKPLTK